MKFKCSSTEFISGLATASRALPTRTTIEALECVLLETIDDDVRITCSDAQLTIRVTLPATVEEGGAILLPGKLLTDIVRRLPEGELQMNTSGTVAKLTCAGSRTQLTVRGANIYPSVGTDTDGNENGVTMRQKDFREMIETTGYAIAQDEERPILTGCLFEVTANKAVMVALDGYRMAVCEKVLEKPANVYAVIPGKALQEIASLLSEDEEQEMTVAIDRGRFSTVLGNTEIFAVLKEGEFVKYANLIPTGYSTRVEVDCASLLSCVSRAAVMAKEDKNSLRLEIGFDSMEVITSSQYGDMNEKVSIALEGEPIVVGFNVKYITDALRKAGDGNVWMDFTSPIAPCIVTPANTEPGSAGSCAYLHMILPIRLRADQAR